MPSPDPTRWVPPEPDAADTPRASATGHIRYEDIAQDGRVMLLALPHSLGLAVWGKLLEPSPHARALMKSGVIPILTRLVIDGEEATVSVRKPLDFHGCYEMAHGVDERGEVNRVFVNMWTRADGISSRTYGTPPADAGSVRTVGRVFAEHTFTRLFAPPDQRRVVALEADGVPRMVPPQRYVSRPPLETLALPPGATPLDEALVPDDIAVAFGLMHTDSNQHVNSLVYPWAFEEAGLRRLAARGQRTTLLARHLEVVYRKPMFAGERARIVLQAYELGGRLGVVGAFLPEPADLAQLPRAHAFRRMQFG